METLALHPSPDYVSDVIRETGTYYEIDVLEEVARRLVEMRPGVLVDAGAMIGNHTVYLAEHVAHKAIHAFEPVPANLALLTENVARYPKVWVHPVALTDAPGRVNVDVQPDNWGHGVVGSTGIEVGAVTLDSLNLPDVRLIKIDVEGHEPQVLAGAPATIERWRPLLVIEDWRGPPNVPGYDVAVSWETAHQTFLLTPAIR